MRKDGSGVRHLVRIARKTVELAVQGEAWAIQEVGNRLDGKPLQQQQVSVAHTHTLALSDAQLAEMVERFERKMVIAAVRDENEPSAERERKDASAPLDDPPAPDAETLYPADHRGGV